MPGYYTTVQDTSMRANYSYASSHLHTVYLRIKDGVPGLSLRHSAAAATTICAIRSILCATSSSSKRGTSLSVSGEASSMLHSFYGANMSLESMMLISDLRVRWRLRTTRSVRLETRPDTLSEWGSPFDGHQSLQMKENPPIL